MGRKFGSADSVEKKCEVLLTRIMSSLHELARMNKRLNMNGQQQSDLAYWVYKARLMVPFLEEQFAPEFQKEEMYSQMKEWEHSRRTIRDHAVDTFIAYLEKLGEERGKRDL